ncbi:MAG: hypothetical protein ACK58Q_07330 [Chitinophagales bacterium]
MTNKERAKEFKELIGLIPKNFYKVCLEDENLYYTWFIYITFHNYDKFIEIEGDFDGVHIKIELSPLSEIEKKINLYKKSDIQFSWDVHYSNEEEIFNQTINHTISKRDYSIDKGPYKINETFYSGHKELFNRLIIIIVRIKCNNFPKSLYR